MGMRTASGTRRMTVAQAVVEYLSKQYTVDSVGGQDYRERLIPGHVRHLRPRQRCRRRPGPQAVPAARSDDHAVLPGPQRAGPGAPGRRLRPAHPAPPDVRDQHLDRPGFLEPAHRCGAGHHQPAAGAAAAQRHLRHPRRGPGPAAARAALRLRHHRQRRLPAAVQVLRPRLPARAAVLRVPPRPARPDGPGRDRRRHHLAARRTSRPRPSTCPRNSWPSANGGSAAPTPTTRTSAAPPRRSAPRSAR